MKRKLLFLLGIIAVICMIMNVAFAESWTCPNCGASNTGNFCSNCGTAKPASSGAGAITNVTFSPQSNGDILVEWDDSSPAASYTVKFTTDFWDITYLTEATSGKRMVMKYLIPGVTYQITVTNGTSDVTQTYKVPRPIFTEFSTGGKYLNLTEDRFSLSEMEKKPTMTFDVQVS